MPELRWILVVVGLLLLASLWLWETRRRHRQEEDDLDADETPAAPAAGRRPNGVAKGRQAPTAELPPIRASRQARTDFGRNPPVVEFPGGMEPELPRAGPDTAFVPPSVPYREMQHETLQEIPEELRDLPRGDEVEAARRQPWVSTQPIDRTGLQAGNGQPGEAPAAAAQGAAAEPVRDEAPSQRIVALRLIAARGRWPGRTVIEALQAEGLSFGKYSIYHRQRDDGKSIFFVASMIEPGSFDLEDIDAHTYPGISVFAVIPGPLDAPTTFDLMLSTARRLAERLAGHLQDEQGSTLTAQRILNLREELVHFEHVARRVQKR
jgi:cell division protein ZipA